MKFGEDIYSFNKSILLITIKISLLLYILRNNIEYILISFIGFTNSSFMM